MLSHKIHYLQVALNSTLTDAKRIISSLPPSERILIEAGTPLIKEFGGGAISQIRNWWQSRLSFSQKSLSALPYIVADLKCMDRGEREVEIAARAGASAVTVLGQSPVETIDILIQACEKRGIDPIIDMMNLDQPYKVLRKLKRLPKVVMLHRGVDETEKGNRRFPIHQINKVKGAFDVLVAIGGGDTSREVQSAVFNGADIVMVWKEFYHHQDITARLAEEFLQQIK